MKNLNFYFLKFQQKTIVRKFFFTVVALFIYSVSYGQFFSIGPRVGISSSKLEIKENVQDVKEGDASFGFHAGLFTRFSFTSLYIQPEVLFTSNGGEIEFEDGVGNQIIEYDYNKLDVPVMVGFKFAKFFRLQAGPVASLLLKADAKNGGVTDDVKNNYKNATIGYQAGVGLDIGSLILDLKYEGNLSKFGNDIRVAGNNFNTDIRNNQWLLSLGIKL